MPLDSLTDLLGYCGAGETRADPYLPFLDHCTPHAMLLRDGSVLGTARLPGPPFPLLGNVERNSGIVRHIAFLNGVADDNVEVFEHLVRHDHVPAMPPRPAPVGAFDAAFLRDYDAAVAKTLRANDWFITILVRPRRTPLARVGRALKGMVPGPLKRLLPGHAERMDDAQDDHAAERDDLLAQLEDAFALCFGLLRDAAPVRLGLRTEGPVVFSEIAEALELIRTTKFLKQPLVDPAGTLGAGLAAHDPIAGRGGFEVRYGPGGYDSHFGSILGVTSWPRDICQDQFDALLTLDGRFVLTNHIRFMNRAQQQEDLQLMRRLVKTSSTVDEEAAEQLRQAALRVGRGEEVRGYGRWSLAIHADPDPLPDSEVIGKDGRRKLARSAMRKVDRLVSEVRTIMASAGVRVSPEGKGAKSALIAQTPGAPRRNQIRAGSIPTDYFVSLSTLAGFARGPGAYRWGGPTLRYATSGGTAYDDDLFVGDVAHEAIIGPNGGGKTVHVGAQITACRALVRAGRRPGTQILLDVDNSNEQTILANGGTYVPIKGGGEDSGVAPLRLPNTRRTRAMLRSFIAGLTQIGGEPPPSPEEIVGIREGVNFVMHEMAPHERHLGVVRSFMGFARDGAGARLERWCRQFGGDLAWAFDGSEHRIDFDVELAGVDVTGVMDEPLVMPAMGQLLLWMASEMMDGRRCIVWCEEAPAYFARPEFSRMGKAIALRARKRNACFKAIAQMPEHLLGNEAGKAIIKQSRRLVLFRNAGAEEADYCGGLGLPRPIFEMVRRGMFELPYHAVCIVRRDGQSSVCRFDLSSLPHYLAVFSATTNSVRLFRSILDKNGPADMQANLAEFWRRLPEAAA